MKKPKSKNKCSFARFYMGTKRVCALINRSESHNDCKGDRYCPIWKG